MRTPVYNILYEAWQKKQKSFAVLIDPDETDTPELEKLILLSQQAGVDYFFVGGSLVVTDRMVSIIRYLKQNSHIPVIIFPGSVQQVCPEADAILFLSLISGRNPDLLIGNQILAAPFVKKSGLEAIATGYILVDGGAPTTVSYISNTLPIPADKDDIAVCTAMAGELLGMKLIYMDSGSGAKHAVSAGMLSAVSRNINIPLIVGGGIRTPEKAYENCQAGADIIVVGNAIEKDTTLIKEISFAIHTASVPSA
ncbi:MAG: geranylgeranylglyceryl/heptaprenylglyceryl phosphate synthase [Chitinophagales bacterium]